MNQNDNVSARVFISCGQREGEELNTALSIEKKLRSVGYDPYVAGREQSLLGFTHNILPKIDESEYYIFVDFVRSMRVKDGSIVKNAYSLFSHQELAIAAFLEKESLIFLEESVEMRDGIAGFNQLNPIYFQDRESLPDEVLGAATKAKWRSDSRLELKLERNESESEIINTYGSEQIPATFYHIDVKNHHHRTSARNCVCYLESIKDLQLNQRKILEPVEIKWKGTTVQHTLKAPKFARKFDAIRVLHRNKANEIYIGINTFITDYSGYLNEYRLANPGKYELVFIVFTDNFRPSKATFILDIGQDMNVINFAKLRF